MQKLGMARSDRGLFFEKQARGSNYCAIVACNSLSLLQEKILFTWRTLPEPSVIINSLR
jgi:hypothetical protein